MNIQIKKAVKDLQSNYARTILVILALIIGLVGVGAIIVSYTIATNDLNENFLRTDPFHVEVTSKNFELLDLDEFRQRPEVESAEFRDLSKERIEAFPGKWIPLLVYGVEDFNNFNLGEFFNEEGKTVPEIGTMLMERDSKKISNLTLGSVAQVRVGNGKLVSVPISGISFDPAEAPATQDHRIYAYVDKETFTQITGQESSERLIFRLKNINTKDDVEKLAETILKDFESSGIIVDKILIPKPNTHPHQWQMNTLLFLEGSIGLLAFLMSAILVWQLITAILAGQIRQIGVLKSIGATSVQVFKIYLTMVLLLGIIAGIIAIPLAVKFGYAFAGFVAGQLNFDILTTSLPFNLYVSLIAMAILLPVLTSLPVLLKGVRISAYSAMNDYGISQNNKKNRNKRIFSKLPLPKSIVLAFRNTFRRKGRLIITIITLALGVAIFSTGFNVQQSINVMLDDQSDALNYDVQLTLKEPLPLEQALAPFSSLDNVINIETRSGAKGVIQASPVETTDEATIFALPYNTELFRPEVLQGRWLQKSDEPEMVINQLLLETFENPIIGEYYTLNIKGELLNFKLVGVIKEFALERIYIDKEIFESYVNTDNLVKSIVFVAKENSLEKIIDLEKDIEKALSPTTLSVVNVESQSGRMKILEDHLNVILVMLIAMALLVLVVGSLGMASAMSINIIERTREIGVLRAIGATPKVIYRLFVVEGMIISISSIVLGLLLAWPLSIVASAFFGNLIMEYPFDFAFSFKGLWITLIVTLVFGFLASRVPASKAIKVSTREALSYE